MLACVVERERERQTDRQTDTERQTDRQRETERIFILNFACGSYLFSGSTHADIEIFIGSKTFRVTKEMTQGNHTITVWTEYYSTYKYSYIGVRGKRDLPQLSVCYIKAYGE